MFLNLKGQRKIFQDSVIAIMKGKGFLHVTFSNQTGSSMSRVADNEGICIVNDKISSLSSLKVPRNPSNLAFSCTQIGLIHDIFSFFVCKKHYFKK